MRAFFLFLSFVCCSLQLFSQYQLKGKVIDSKTEEPLAFVNIVVNNERMGTTTGIDGNFNFNSPKPIEMLTLSYVGYTTKQMYVDGNKNLLIKMDRASLSLDEFKVRAGENPAHRIIKKAVANRKINDPEKSLDFKYESYSKLFFTALLDSSIINNPEKFDALDSNEKADLNWLEDHHIFLIESVTERKYKQPDKSYEKVMASRVSGFKNPMFSLLATQLQSFSFYKPQLYLMGDSYLNPISVGSTNKYLFILEDTTFSGVDTVYIISFRPFKNKNFDGLKGLLYINTDGFAIQNVIAEPAEEVEDGFGIKIQQKYEKVSEKWFPIQLNSTIIMHNAQVNNYKMLGVGKTYLQNIVINPTIENKEFSNVETEIDFNANKKDEDYWNKYRGDTLSQKEKNTYHVVDSLGKAENLDRKLTWFEALMTGKIKWGFLHVDLNRFVQYNDYEGFRLGAGAHTNERISKIVSVGGYGAYGFKDKEFKYGGDIDFRIHKNYDINLNLSAQKDVEEPGVASFYDYRIPLLSGAGNRVFYQSRMNNMDKLEGRLKFRTLRYLRVYLFANQENVDVTNQYYFQKFNTEGQLLQDNYYTFTNVGVEFRYAFKEKIVKTWTLKLAKPSKYPILYGKIERGLTVLNGEYEYTRFTVRAEKKFRVKNLGTPSFYIEAGLIDGKVPQAKLNTSLGAFRPNTFLIAAENAFETMLPYEFFSSEYISIHLRHSFGSLLFKYKKFEPEVVLVSSIGFGDLSYKGLHGGVAFNTLEKGFYESGVQINRILKLNNSTFGVGVFYRYGPYKFEKESDNLAIKMSLGFAF